MESSTPHKNTLHNFLSFDAADSNAQTMALVSIQRSSIDESTTMNQSPSQAYERRRQSPVARSQSIKILRKNASSYSHHNETDEPSSKAWEEDKTLLEEQYESATLQMYYRITEYRMRNSGLYSNATSAESATETSNKRDGIPFPSTSFTMHINANDGEDSSAINATYISEESGAIFEMDL